MRFIVGTGEQLRDRLQDFPIAWVEDFVASKILVVAVEDENSLAAYGIRGVLNVASVYVKKKYRRQGIAGKIRETAFNEARARGIHFLTAEVPFQYLSSKYGLLLSSKFGCRVVKRLKKHKGALVVFPLTAKGHLIYIFLRTLFPSCPANCWDPFLSGLAIRLLQAQG